MTAFPQNPRTSTAMTNPDQAESAELERYGIVRVPADTFEWNGYRYSHARDAWAAAKRGQAK